MSGYTVHEISDSSSSDCESPKIAKSTGNDSDCTIESDDLNEIISSKISNKRKSFSETSTQKRQKIDSAASNIPTFNLYLTKVSAIADKFNKFLSLNISDILSDDHGELIASVQFNYLIDIPWLMNQYSKKFRSKPLLIVHGHKDSAERGLIQSGKSYSNISFCRAELSIPFGTHHTKMMVLHYEDGLKIVIHTANLVDCDWDKKTQGLWVSDKLPLLKDKVAEKCSTSFKSDLISYFKAYSSGKLKEWIKILEAHNFSSIKVHLVASVPGRHVDNMKHSYGHLKLKKLLSEYGPKTTIVKDSWPVIGQFSSIGSLGNDSNQWLSSEWLASLSSTYKHQFSTQKTPLKLVFPSVDDVRLSLEGYPAGTSLPYSKNTAIRQPYLNSFMHRWKSDFRGRSHCSPHIKSYMRISPDNSKLAWCLLTSANLSKAAWGCLQKKGSQVMIRSYELGVLFLPNSYDLDAFEIMKDGSASSAFPIPIDLPLIPYSKQDKPWTWDEVHREKPDRNGNMWCPS